jgi:hypothetical protein
MQDAIADYRKQLNEMLDKIKERKGGDINKQIHTGPLGGKYL